MGRRGRIALGLVVLAAGAVLAWWFLRAGPRSVFFAEIRFEQGFAALSSDSAPFQPGLVNGFRFLPDTRKLHPAIGEPLASGDLVVGLGWYRPEAHPPRQLGRTLMVTDGPVFRWAEPGPALRAKSDRFAALAEARVVELHREQESCAVSVDGESLRVPIGESARSMPRVRELTLDAAVAALRDDMPGLPEPSATMRTVLALRLDPDADSRVEIHEAYTITCHGEVDLHPDDLLVRLRTAQAALAQGDREVAVVERAALAAIDPNDPIVRALEARIASASDAERVEWSGRVELPAGAAPGLIAEVTLWPAGAGPEAAVVQLPAIGGSFRVSLPPGEYELQCRAPGYAPVRVRTQIPPEGEVRCALH